MALKPTKLPRWATNQTSGSTVEPSESGATGSKDEGWIEGYAPPAPWFNWLFNLIYLWIVYLNDLANIAWTWTQLHIFQKSISVSAETGSNGDGIFAAGDGSGRGISANGGTSTSGTGGAFFGGAPNGIGIEAYGNGSGNGAYIGAGSTGAGLIVSGGGFGNNVGLISFGVGTAFSAQFYGRGIQLIGSAPATNADPGANAIHTSTILKVSGRIDTNGGGTATVLNGSNISSVTVTTTYVQINFVRAFSSATSYAPKVTPISDSDQKMTVMLTGLTASSCRIAFWNAGGSAENPATLIRRFTFFATGT